MFRKSMEWNNGMFFVFDENKKNPELKY